MNIRCGVDIVEVKRIVQIIKKNNNFLKRVFTQREIDYCSKKKLLYEHFAVRFAAKEAVWKALGMQGIALRDISVRNADNGKPEVVIRGQGKKFVQYIDISLSHTSKYAIAMAIYKGSD